MKETSAGAIIFRKTNNGHLFLLLNYPSAHWDFVKGKMEDGESTYQTVIRETKEETNIQDLKFISNFEETIKYDFQFENKTIHKKVIFHLAATRTETVIISNEHLDFLWLNFKEAMQKITYNNARMVLFKAKKLLDE